MDYKYLTYKEAKPLIREADILLFRGQGTIAYFIQRFGEGKYSHVGLASRHNDSIECVEFREWKGGRTVSLKGQVKQNDGLIDVYRPFDEFKSWSYEDEQVKLKTIKFNGKPITSKMREMTGLPYGMRRIWWILQHKMAIWRLFYKMDNLVNDNLQDIVYPVCSTAAAYCFSYYGYDIITHKADNYTEPSDFARGRTSYLFTLTT